MIWLIIIGDSAPQWGMAIMAIIHSNGPTERDMAEGSPKRQLDLYIQPILGMAIETHNSWGCGERRRKVARDKVCGSFGEACCYRKFSCFVECAISSCSLWVALV